MRPGTVILMSALHGATSREKPAASGSSPSLLLCTKPCVCGSNTSVECSLCRSRGRLLTTRVRCSNLYIYMYTYISVFFLSNKSFTRVFTSGAAHVLIYLRASLNTAADDKHRNTENDGFPCVLCGAVDGAI